MDAHEGTVYFIQDMSTLVSITGCRIVLDLFVSYCWIDTSLIQRLAGSSTCHGYLWISLLLSLLDGRITLQFLTYVYKYDVCCRMRKVAKRQTRAAQKYVNRCWDQVSCNADHHLYEYILSC